MGRVAGCASLGPDRSMLEGERSAHIGMALGADCVRILRRPDIVGKKTAVHVVAVGALDQAFIHLVMDRHIELRLLVSMALVAERGLRRLEKLLFLAAMDVMAADAADVSLCMRRAVKIWMGSRMAGLARGVNLFGSSLGRVEDFGDVAAAFNVRAARTMASFAVHAGSAVLSSKLGVRIVRKLLGHFFVARSADIAANI